ncbi:MAG TPA: S-layer homology domain-containing protein [Candidatus Agathobaculum stercoravium]|nr:S-layer homology domain-containing protein [Candidatus Agathobaculum stercoravium]
MKRKMRMVLASVLAVASLAMSAGAASYDNCADRLSDLGLFQGTGDGYELDRAPTRAEAATMLVRLLGAEAEAQELEYTAPFTDLSDWQKPYVQYLYDNGLTNGATATTFEPEGACSAQMYTTFLLRALGYSDAAGGDFAYSGAVDFGESIGLVDIANCNETNFLRDHVAAMSLTALNTAVKDDADTKLLEKLVADGAVEQATAADMLTFFDNYDAYVAAAAAMNDETRMDVSVDMSATVDMDGQQVMTLSMPMEMKMDMDLENMDQSQISMTGTMNMTMDESLVAEGEQSSVSQVVSYYYADGVYYMDLGDQKVKMDMSFEDALAQMGDLANMAESGTSEPICLIDSITTSGNSMTVTYSAAGMSNLVDEVLAGMGMDEQTAGVDFSMDDVTSSVTIENGAVSATSMTAVINMNVEGSAMTMNMSMDMVINETGDGVTVDVPDDLDTYTDIIGGADAAA